MRLFVSVEISDDLRGALTKIKEDLSHSLTLKEAKWVKPENLHLTLKFFGEVPENDLAALEQALVESVKGKKSFLIQVHGMGCFPNLQRPRVLWAGIKEGAQSLEALAKSVEENSVAAGFAPVDKPFSAHLTLARFTAAPPKDFLVMMENVSARSFGEMKIEKISLIESQLSPSGPRYTTLREFSLEI